MKTIYLARHAKSSWDMSFVLNLSSDFDRPLNKRGESDAVKVGNEMKKRLWQPDVIISSPAKRAKQTCLSYCENLDYSSNDIEWETTANVAKLSYKGLWAEIAMGSVSLDALIRPKTI